MPSTPENQGQFEARIAQLTRTQKQVLEMFVQGCDDGAIADSLEIVENTVRQHISRIANKLGIPSDRSDKGFRRREIIKLFRQHAPEQVAEVHYCNELLSGLDARQPVKSTLDTSTVTEHEIVDPLSNDPNFVGREEAIAELDRLRKRGSKLVQIVAAGGQGKTTLSRKYLQSRFSQVIEFAIAKETKDVASVESLLEEKLRQMGEEPGRELMVSIDRLKQKLQSTEIGILIDNLEPALDGTGSFIEEHRSYVELLRILSDPDLKSFTIITSRESLNESSISLDSFKLKGLSFEAWQEYFKYQSVIIEESDDSLTETHHAFGGNAKAMDILSKSIQQDYGRNLLKYWQNNRDNLLIEPTLKNLVREQFKRLLVLDLQDEYNLLCRMGCYRYQDIPTISKEGVRCLLWDVPENQHIKVIQMLKKRGLLETQENEYYLHPVIRKESIDHLIKNSDWLKSNAKAAEYWHTYINNLDVNSRDSILSNNYIVYPSDTVSSKKNISHQQKSLEFSLLEKVRFFLESCRHYVTAQQYSRVTSLFFESVNHDKYPYETWGLTCWRFGCFTQLISIANQILRQEIKPVFLAINFYRTIGYVYHQLGDPSRAIKFYSKCGKLLSEGNFETIANIPVSSHHKIEEISSAYLFDIGLCYLSLWNLEKAHIFFAKSIDKDNRKNRIPWFEDIVYLLFVQSLLGHTRKIREELENNICLYNRKDVKMTFWGKSYVPLIFAKTFQNLSAYDESIFWYKETLCKIEENPFKQVEGDALSSLASVCTSQKKYSQALNLHSKAIEKLTSIDAQCDLAEAYFQYALTYQEIEDQDNAQKYFDEALHLWSPEQINAPKQIERVKKAMNQ